MKEGDTGFGIPFFVDQLFLRQCSTDVGVPGVLLIREVNDEDDVILGFEGGDDGSVAGLVGDRLFVDRGDDQAFAQVDLIGEGAGANAGDHDAAADSGVRGDIGRNGRDGDAEGGLAYIGLLRSGVIVPVSDEIGISFSAIADDDVSNRLLSVADVAKFDGRADSTCGDIVDQIVAALDVASIDGDEDVAGLNAGLGCALARNDRADDNAVGEAVHAVDGGVDGGLEADADGAADDLMCRPDEIVIDLGDGVGRHGESEADRSHGLGIDGGVHADDLAGHID